MKEIKFRGKRVDNSDWVYGSHTKEFHQEGTLVGFNHYIVEESKPYTKHLVQIPTICQYTGLKDKNGVEIYEGDILRDYGNDIEDWVVSYEYGKFVGTFDNVCEDLYEIHDLEVIGNIYENNEKLKEEEIEKILKGV